jgi:hypothetical protein
MKTLMVALVLVAIFALALPMSAQAYTQDCFGQATAAFAQMGEMGEHASQQANPRDGLGNLARDLYKDGVLDAPTLQALAAWLVSIDPDLTVEACMN